MTSVKNLIMDFEASLEVLYVTNIFYLQSLDNEMVALSGFF